MMEAMKGAMIDRDGPDRPDRRRVEVMGARAIVVIAVG
jgi:hypothetical protein